MLKAKILLNLKFTVAEPCALPMTSTSNCLPSVSGHDLNRLPSGAIGFVTVSGNDLN